MKTIVTIEYKRIGFRKVSDEMLDDKNVKKSINDFSKKLCDNLDRYLKESKIKAKITYKLK